MTQPPQSSSPGPLSPQNGPYGQGGVPSPGPAPQQGHGSPQQGFGPPQQGYSQAPQGVGQAPAKKPSKAPKILIILGAVLLALSLIIGVVLAVIGIGGVVGGTQDLEVFDSGSGTITAEEGESLQIFAEEGAPAPSCTVDGPSVGEGTSQSSTIGIGGRSWVSVDSFTAEQAGDYTVTCGDSPIAVGPPVSIGGIFAGVGGILLAVFGGALGFLLLLIGVILVIVRKKRTA